MSSLLWAGCFFFLFFLVLLLFVAICRSNRCVLAAINSVAVPLRAMVFLRKDENVREKNFFLRESGLGTKRSSYTYPIVTLLLHTVNLCQKCQLIRLFMGSALVFSCSFYFDIWLIGLRRLKALLVHQEVKIEVMRAF